MDRSYTYSHGLRKCESKGRNGMERIGKREYGERMERG